MGQQIFDSDGTFTVPVNVYRVNVCMIGGGGSGASTDEVSCVGGGYAGDIFHGDFDVNNTTPVAVTVGSGGTRVSNSDGNSGSPSSFGDESVDGGAGGEFILDVLSADYAGNHASRDTCQGTSYDGYSSNGTDESASYGGQAGFGDGGSARYADNPIPIGVRDGGVGAGGGAQAFTHWEDDKTGGAGGNGRVIVNWDDYLENGGLLINGSLIPEVAGAGELHFYCKDHLGADFDGAVQELMLDGQLVWKEI